MAKKIYITYNGVDGEANIKHTKKGLVISYGEDTTLLAQLVLIGIFIYLTYRAITYGEVNIFLAPIVALLATAAAYWALKLISFVLGPLGKLLINPSQIVVCEDLIYASGSSSESTEVSKLGVAAKFASLAMAGAMSEKGKKIGRNVYLGAAAMTPNTYKKTTNFITFYHKNGLQGCLSAGEGLCETIIQSVNQTDLKLVEDYTLYLRDYKVNPDVALSEVKLELDKLIDLMAKQAEIAKSGESAKSRQGASNTLQSLSQKLKVMSTLKNYLSSQATKAAE